MRHHRRHHSTISAVSTTAWNSTSAPAVAHSIEMSSASLWLRPSTQGHMIMVEGANHAWSLETADFDYTGKVVEFFDRHLKAGK